MLGAKCVGTKACSTGLSIQVEQIWTLIFGYYFLGGNPESLNGFSKLAGRLLFSVWMNDMIPNSTLLPHVVPLRHCPRMHNSSARLLHAVSTPRPRHRDPHHAVFLSSSTHVSSQVAVSRL